MPAHAGHDDAHHEPLSLVAGLPGWAYALVVSAPSPRWCSAGTSCRAPLFRFIAASRLREIFTAAALLLVIGIALLMSLVDLSPALGTFLAGVVLPTASSATSWNPTSSPSRGCCSGCSSSPSAPASSFGCWPSDALFIVIGLTLG
jgi:hypothetical protein